MEPPSITTPARPTTDSNERHSEYDPYGIPDEEDLRQGSAPPRPNKKVIIHLDMDCYEAQVWTREMRPELEYQDVPVVVVNFDKAIRAVNYTAQALGVKREMEPHDFEKMEQKHRELISITAGDSLILQKRSDEIFQVLLDFQKTLNDPDLVTIERSSKDEGYLDVTNLVKLRTKPAGSKQVLRLPQRRTVDKLTSAKKTHPNVNYKGKSMVVMEAPRAKIHGSMLKYRIQNVYPKGLATYHADETALAHGACIAFKLIQLIKDRTGFDGSAGVAHNKLLAKLACRKNKPQGITIMTDRSISRVSKKLEFTGIPGYGGKRGGDLLAYFSKRGHYVTTLHDVINLPFDALVAAFKAVGSSDEKSDAKALRGKCRGEDVSAVRQRFFADTINTSIKFRGTHSMRPWDDFRERVFNLSRDVADRVEYSRKHWNRSPQSLAVKATLRRDSNTTPSSVSNRRGIDGFVDIIAIYGFIVQLIQANNLDFVDIEEIKVTAADFQGSSENEVANIAAAAKDHDMPSAAEGTGSGPVEVKIISLYSHGSGAPTLPERIRKLSERIADKIDHYITTQWECPSELVVNVTLFNGAGPKVQLTKEHSLEVFTYDPPEHLTIKDFIIGYIEENHLETPQIETIGVTLKRIEKIRL